MSTDRELILKLKDNDTGAFDILYWKYHQAIYRNALKLTKDEDAAADILQEVFSILWEKRQAIKEDQFVSGWLFTISFNQSINFQRKKLRETVAHSQIGYTHHENDEENFGYQYALMQKAVEQLSPQKQKVFTLCKLDGKSYKETADLLNISKHTVKEYLSYAMIFIKEYVKSHSKHWLTTGFIVLFSGYSSLGKFAERFFC
jgi:RNA polymerase sigma factor (sigma-70 family)